MSDTVNVKITVQADARQADALRVAIERLIASGGRAAASNAAQAAALSRAQAAAAQAAAAQQRLATEQQRTAQAAQRLATEQARTAAAAARAEQAALRLAEAQRRAAAAAEDQGGRLAALPRTFAGVTQGVAATITGMVSLGAAFEAGKAIVQSFVDAFKFKAELDATTASINAQLQGVRDSNQVYAAAAAFGREFKLTQEEQTQAIAASIGVIRQSKAPIEDILSVLSRMQILSPEQSLEEAAIALKGLAGGDTQSLVTRFEVSRDRANEMKAAIAGGADAVQVMSQFLNETGIGMEALKARTEGAAGAMKNVALAQEELKLAQAEFAQGPGLAILQTQIEATTGLTRLLTGDVDAMGQSLTNSADAGTEAMINLANATGQPIAVMEALHAIQRELEMSTVVLDGIAGQSIGTWGEVAAAVSYQSDAMIEAGNIATQLITQHAALAGATQQNASESLIDAANKETQTAQTQLLQAETLAAAEAFMALHPNISASGVASLAAAGQINPLLAQLVMARIRADEARAALAAFNAQAGIKGLAGKGAAAMGGSSAQRFGFGARGEGTGFYGRQDEEEQERRLSRIGGAKDILAQQRARARALSGGGGRAAGGGARISEEQKVADKILQINQQTADKLAEIDRRAAESRAAALRSLNEAIISSSNDLVAEQEANDLELVGASEEQRGKLIAREQAEAKARIANEQAVSEAKAMAAAGDAEQAEAVLSVRQDAIQKQQQLDEEYAQRQQELADDPALLAILQQQYQEATEAAAKAEADAVELKRLAAEQKKQAAEQEKQDILANAQEQLAGVKGASEAQRDAVLASLAAQASGAASWASAVGSATASVISDARAAASAIASIPSVGGGAPAGGGGGGGGPKAAGGARGITRGPMTVRIGDNPGGIEFFQAIPLSGRGTSSMGAGFASLAGGGVIGSVPGLPDPGVVKSLVDTGLAGGRAAASGAKSGGGKGASDAVAALKDQLDAAKQAIDLLKSIAELRDLAARPQFPIDDQWIWGLSKEAAMIAQIVKATAIPMTEEATKELGFYVDAAEGAISLLSSVADLRAAFQAAVGGEAKFPISDQWVWGLSKEAGIIYQIISGTLIPTTEATAEGIATYADAVGSAIALLNDVAGLRETMAEAKDTPLNSALLEAMADEAKRVLEIIQGRLIPTTEQQADAIGLYSDAASSAIALLNDTQSLREALEAPRTPIPEAYIIGLADEAKRVAEIMRTRLVPTTQEQADAAALYADAVGASVGALSSVLDLSGALFTDYRSPTDAEIGMIATDAQRITRAFFDAAQLLGKDGSEAAKAYGEALGATFGAAKDALLVMDAIKSGDFTLDPKALAQFEAGSLSVLDVMERLGGRAAQIPASSLAALQASSAAASAQAESLIRMNAVPFGNLSTAGAGYAASGGTSVIVNIYNPPANMDVGAVAGQAAQIVKRELSSGIGMRR